MVIDTSAFLAILQDEPERASFTKAIEAAAVRRTSAATFLEASIVLESRHGADGVRLLDVLIESASIEVVAVDFAQAKIARRAFAHFGKGRQAELNYGDCFAYALARRGNRCSARAKASREQTSPGPSPRFGSEADVEGNERGDIGQEDREACSASPATSWSGSRSRSARPPGARTASSSSNSGSSRLGAAEAFLRASQRELSGRWKAGPAGR